MGVIWNNHTLQGVKEVHTKYRGFTQMIEITFCLDCKKGTRGKPAACQCGKSMMSVLLDETGITCFKCDIDQMTIGDFSRELIEAPNSSSSYELPANIYDFHFEWTFKGIQMILHTWDGFVNCENFTVSVSANPDSELFKPCQFNQMTLTQYQEVFAKHNESRFCPVAKKNSKPFKMKVVSELSRQCTFAWPKDLQIVYFDIETFMLDGDYCTIPKHEFPRTKAQIGMITQVTQIGEQREYTIYARDRYYANIPLLREKLGLANIVVKLFTSEAVMCNEFLKQFADSAPTILTGFNASSRLSLNWEQQDQSSWDKHTVHGYDLGWIAARSTIKLTPLNGFYKVSSELRYKITKGFTEFPNLYIVDSQLLFAQQLKPDDLKDMVSRDLDGYLTTFGLSPKKAHNYYTMQERLANANTDLTDVLEYALYDSIALDQAFTCRDILKKIQAEMQLWNVPFSFALYETANTKNQVIISRKLLNNSLLPSYTVAASKPDDSDDGKIKGAFTFTNQDDILKVHKEVLCFDFNSLYPSCIISFNLSADTLCQDPQAEFGDQWEQSVNIIDCRDDPTIGKSLYFYKEHIKMGVLPDTCREFISKRKQIKQQMRDVKDDPKSSQYRALDNQQLAVKVGVNAMFGGMASQFNPLYKREVSAATTACARRAIHSLNRIVDGLSQLPQGRTTRVIANDTDSVFMIADDLLGNDVDQRETNFNWIQSTINQELTKQLGPLLKVEAEEIIRRFCPSKSKKSYFRHDQSLNDFFWGNDTHYDLICKGVQWSRLHKYNRSLIRKFFEQYLLKGSRENLAVMLQEHVEEYHRLVKDAIESQQIPLLQKYAIRLRSSSKAGHEVLKRHQSLDIKEDYIYVVRLIGTHQHLRDTQSQLVPIQSLTPDTFKQIDFVHLTQNYHSQLDKFFKTDASRKGKLKKQMEAVVEDIQEGQMLVRIETFKPNYGVIRELVAMTPTEAHQLGQANKKLSIHEVLHKPYIKLFFDIDGDQELNIFDFKEQLNRSLFNHAITHYFELAIATCHRGSKKSYHIVVNLVMHKVMIKVIASDLKGRYPAIDLAVYEQSSLRSLRFIGCSKIKPDGLIDPTPFETNSTPEQMSITVTDDCQVVYLSPCFDSQSIFKIANSVKHRELVVIQNAIQKEFPYLSIESHQNYFYLLAIESEQSCPVCKKPHQIAGKIYAVVSNKAISIRCFKASNDDKTSISIPMQDELAKPIINPNVEYAGDFIPTQNSRFVEFEFISENEILAVRSPLGSGKSEQTIKIVKNMNNPSVVVLSIRHTLSQDMEKRYLQTGLPVRVYDDIKGRISVDAEVLICQVESIQRLVDQTYDLLVLDEFQSILEQLGNGLVRDPQALYSRFIKLIDQSKRILILDGQLQKSSIDAFEFIAQRPVRIVYNIYKPYLGHTFRIHRLKNANDLDIAIGLIEQDLNAGKNIYSHCNSRSRVFAIESHLKKQSFNCRIYHGQNLRQEEEAGNHGLLKKQHFSDVQSYWKSFQFLAYSSAVSAGVDFSLDHFYRGIHVFVPNSSSPMAFTQAIFRTRKFQSNIHDLFIAEREAYQVNSNSQHFEYLRRSNQSARIILPCASRPFALEVTVDAYKRAMQANRTNIIIANLKDLGCSIEVVEDVLASNALTKELLEDLPPVNLQASFLTTCQIQRQSLSYFVAQPHQRQAMIRDNQIVANCEFEVQAIAIAISVGKLTNITDTDESLMTIQNTLNALRETRPASKLIDIYTRNKSYMPFKRAFGRLYDKPVDWVIEHVNATVRQQAELIKLGQTMKGVTLSQLIDMADQSIKARKWVDIIDQDERELKAKEWFKYTKNKYYQIYGFLGQDYEAEYKRCRQGANLSRILSKETIMPFPCF